MYTLAVIVALANSLVTTPPPGGTDNGFFNSTFCDELSWNTLPIYIYFPDLDAAQISALVRGITWWNNSALADQIGGPVFEYLDPLNPPISSYALIVVGSSPDPTPHGSKFIFQIGCIVTQVNLIFPDIILPDITARIIHLLGHGLSLTEDEYWCSVMDPRFLYDLYISNFICDVTSGDVDRIVNSIFY